MITREKVLDWTVQAAINAVIKVGLIVILFEAYGISLTTGSILN